MKTILIADDSPSIRKLLELVLRSKGYQVLIAEEGRQALKIAFENDLDAIVADEEMPRLNGGEIFRILMADPEKRSIPRIMISGLTVENGQPAKELADIFIPKDTNLKINIISALEKLV